MFCGYGCQFKNDNRLQLVHDLYPKLYETFMNYGMVKRECPSLIGVGVCQAECMGKDIAELLKCDAVYFCKGWEKSNGCLLEFAAAKLYHKTIIMQ